MESPRQPDLSSCPACKQPMTRLDLPQKSFGTVSLDLCFPCQGIWFDQFESVQISPGGIIELFKLINTHRDELRNPHPGALHCPRCKDKLLTGLDVVRSGRFTYHRCLQNHGRFITFAQFMIEKGFVRQLAPAEIKELAARVGTIHCTGCGAPVDIRTQATCSHCAAPIAILDPDAVKEALASYQHQEFTRTRRDPEAMADALLAIERQRKPRAGAGSGLMVSDVVRSGIGVILDLIP